MLPGVTTIKYERVLPISGPWQDLDTMEESTEIKVEANTARTSWIQSSMVAGGKRVSKALSYITGEMKECGEGLKGTFCDFSPLSLPSPRWKHIAGFSADQPEGSFWDISDKLHVLLKQSVLGYKCQYL
jgi:hypothetical protein